MPEQPNVRLVDTEGAVNPAAGGVGQGIDGNTVATGNRVLLVSPPNGRASAGPWVAAAGPWSRPPEWDEAADVSPGDWWYVEEGAEYQATTWAYEDPDPPEALGVTPLTVGQRARRRTLARGSGIDISGTTPPVVSFNSPSDLQSTFWEGLRVDWLSGNSVRVNAGACFVPQAGVVGRDRPVDLAGLVLDPGAWYYLYAFDAGSGVLGVDPPSRQRPASPYRGEARVKGGGAGGALDNANPDVQPDDTRRLIGELWAGPAGVLRRFRGLGGGFVRWIADQNTALRAGADLVALVGADLDVSPFAPPYADGVEVGIRLYNADSASFAYVSAAGDELMTAGGSEERGQLWVATLSGGVNRQQTSGPVAFAGSTVLRHRQTGLGTSRSLHIDVSGYYRRLS